MWNSLRTRLTIIFISLATAPLLLVGIVLVQQSFAFEQQQAFDLQGQVAQRVSTEISAFIQDVENDLQLIISEMRSQEQLDRAQQIALLLNKFSTGPFRDVYEEFILLDGQGQEQLRLSRLEITPADELIDRSGMPEFQEPKASRGTYFSPVWFDTATGQPLMTIAIPIFELRSVQLSGVLMVSIHFKTIGNLIADLQVSEGQTIYLIDPTGQIVAHQDPAVPSGNLNVPVPEEAGTHTALDGTDVAFGIDTIQLGDQIYTVVAERSLAEVLQVAYSTMSTMVITILVASVIAAGLAFLIVRQIIQPINALATTAQAISAGDLSQQVEISRLKELGALAAAFNSMAVQLNQSFETQEERIRERTRALETSAEISRQITTIVDRDELLKYLINRLQSEFNFYHIHIYLMQPENDELFVVEGSGEAGQKLKAQNHKLKVGHGIVGNVASSGEPFLARDVDQVPDFIRNPLLPKTRSELAVPLRKGDTILGVLDLQNEEINGFDQNDLTLMQSIADQVAIALDNAQLFQRMQINAARAEELNRRLTREAWQGIEKKIQTTGYTFTKSGVMATSSEWLPAMSQAVRQKSITQNGDQMNGSSMAEAAASVAIPLTLRGEVIGVIGIERPTGRKWSEDELTALQTVTEQVTLALDAARLSRETQRSAWRDQVVSESTAQIWSSDEIEEVMRAAVAQLGDKLRASEVVIRLGTQIELE